MDMQQEQLVETQDSDAAANAAAEEINRAVDDQEGENLDSDSEEQAEEEEEVEIGEKKYALPKSAAERLKSERMMQADYTQKTQGVAEERKQIAAEREQNKRQAVQAQEYLDDMAEARHIDKQLALYRGLDWAKLIDDDPKEAMLYQQQQRDLEAQRAEIGNKITTKQSEKALSEQQDIAKRAQDAEAYIAREIKGVTAERIGQIDAYARSLGMDPAAYARAVIHTPQVLLMAHKAELYDALIKKQAPKVAPSPAAQPATRVVGASATVKKDPTKMSDSEFAAHRRNVSKRR